jgi:hypothetical protein
LSGSDARDARCESWCSVSGMGGGSGKLAGREGAVSPISWWPVTRLKVSMVVIVRSNARVVWCAGDVRGGWDWSPGGSVGLGCRIGCEVGRSVVTGSLLALGILVTYGAPVGAAHMVAVNAACRRASAASFQSLPRLQTGILRVSTTDLQLHGSPHLHIP